MRMPAGGLGICRQVAGEDSKGFAAVEMPSPDGLAGQRIADDAGKRLSVLLSDAFARCTDRGERERLHPSAGIVRAPHRVIGKQSEDRLEPVVTRVMQMVGLGRGENDAVDV